MNEHNEYNDEVEKRWGNTQEYKQSLKKTQNYTKDDWEAIRNESDAIFDAFYAHINDDLSSDDVVSLVEAWQNHITQYYYDCTIHTLLGLAEMYVADERFKKNIDTHGEGLAVFISDAIREYVIANT